MEHVSQERTYAFEHLFLATLVELPPPMEQKEPRNIDSETSIFVRAYFIPA